MRNLTDLGLTEGIEAFSETGRDRRHTGVDGPRKEVQPEKLLMIAVLEGAARTFKTNCGARAGRKRRLYVETEEWFWSDDTTWPFSFVNICCTLDLDVRRIRRRLDAWRRGVAERAAGALGSVTLDLPVRARGRERGLFGWSF